MLKDFFLSDDSFRAATNSDLISSQGSTADLIETAKIAEGISSSARVSKRERQATLILSV